MAFPAPVDSNADGLLDQNGAVEGAHVKLKTDKSQDVYDRFKRALAFVNVVSGGQPNRPPGYDLGLEQIRAGWATTYVFQNVEFARFNSYSGTEEAASALSAGVHGKCGGNFHTPT